MSRRRIRTKLPDTEYFGTFHTKYAAQTFVQGICMMLRVNGIDPPAFGIISTRNKELFGMRTLWEVWKPKV